MRFQVISPDGLPIAPRTFASRAAAERARDRWCARFEAQGYYAAVGRRIALADLPAACTIDVKRPSLDSLRRQAAQSTAFRGHRMTWQVIHGESRSLALGTCRRCEMQVTCNTRPEPNGIDIGGEAVALNCTGKPAPAEPGRCSACGEFLGDNGCVTIGCDEAEDAEPTEPQEGDITTEDHRTFYQYGKVILEPYSARDEEPHTWLAYLGNGTRNRRQVTIKANSYEAALRHLMEADSFWPSVWWISDHGNAHRIDLTA